MFKAMKIIVCAKQVPDPDAINAFALGGRLVIDPVSKALRAPGVPHLMNAYDEQALEAALRLRDGGAKCEISVLTLGGEKPQQMFSRAFAMGAEACYHVEDAPAGRTDGLATARILARAIKHLGETDLVLCGRQASDDDQGVVGLALATALDMPCITIAKSLAVVSDKMLRVVRVLPDGEEEVEVALPAVVTISSELGSPRFPKAAELLAARRKKAVTLTAGQLGIDPGWLGAAGSQVRQVDLYVPDVQGKCEFIPGDDAGAMAAELARRLRAARVI